MSDNPRISGEEMDAYLDNQYEGEAKLAFEQRLGRDPQAQQQLADRRLIDNALRSNFDPSEVSSEQVLYWLEEGGLRPSSHRVSPLWWGGLVGAFVTAATLAWLMLSGRMGGDLQSQPVFKPRALAAIYSDVVDAGFRPYYFCDDMDRFAATFEKRQGQGLVLSEMPDDRYMVGLSYLGGISRDTTAMLCRVDRRPVIVFVDKRNVNVAPDVEVTEGSDLFVHRTTLGELVFYEVGPFEQPRMIEFLRLARAGAAN